MSYQSLEIRKVLEGLEVDANKGLSSEEANKRLKKYGENKIKEKKRFSTIGIFLRQFCDFLTIILIVSVFLSLLIGKNSTAIAILLVVVINVVLGFVMEYKSEQSLRAMKEMISKKSRVVRDGQEMMIDSSSVVPGDILIIEAGQQIPADARIIEETNLVVDQSVLTGESVPVEKYEELKDGQENSENLLFSGTTAMAGQGRAVVITTGKETEFGQIAESLSKIKEPLTPLQKQVARLGKLIVFIGFVLAIIILILNLFREAEFLIQEQLILALSIFISVAPSGLLVVMTLTLAMGIQRMAREKAIVKKMSSVETLGSTQIICTDKTGTLTENKMTVKKIWVGGEFFQIQDFFDAKSSIDAQTLIKIGVLCNSTEIVKNEKGDWTVLGDPTEGSFLVLGEKAGYNEKETKNRGVVLQEFAFEQKLRRRGVVFEENGEISFSTMGSPENILALSSFYLKNDKKIELDENYQKIIKENFYSLAKDGYRVMAFAKKILEKKTEYEREELEKELVFVGLAAIYDPPRLGVKESIQECRAAGIKIIMITGDNELTAVAIAKEVDLIEGEERVLLGDEIEKMNDQQLSDALEHYNVFARTMPHHKFRIIEALQKKGKVVAVTGDGVNDAAAIKEADIGIAMGIRGTDVSKEAADMIIADDNFISIARAVKEGRIIYDNIKKFIQFLLAANVIEAPLIMIAIILGMPLPLTPLHILWINFVTDSLPAVTLGIEPGEKGIMKKKPREPKEHILSGTAPFIVFASLLGLVVSFFLFQKTYDPLLNNLVYSQTIVFTFIVIYKLFLVFSAKSNSTTVFKLGFFSNKKMVWAVIFSFLAQLAVIYWASLQEIFGTAPLLFSNWFNIFLLAGAMFLLIEIKKIFFSYLKFRRQT